MEKNLNVSETPDLKIVESPDLGYYSIRYGDFTIGTFNFASFAEKEMVKTKGNNLITTLRTFSDDKIEVKVCVCKLGKKQ